MSAERAIAEALPPELLARIRGVLSQVPDPEIPVISVLDLGVIRHLSRRPDGRVEVGIAPTYSGCPATPAIKADVLRALTGAGFDAVAVDVLSPAWTTDWISEEGRRRLEAYGIAPPGDSTITCPRCGSKQTAKQSEFGSTPCKALYKCQSCLEPFEYFKCI
jgi:ring-1,2-phenylacetyl-CoA epoxidase subunit PaaD